MKNFFVKAGTFLASMLATVSAFAYECGAHVASNLESHIANIGGMMFLSAVPDRAAFNSRRVTNVDQAEVIRQRFYDSLLYPAAGVQTLSFFSNPQGSGVTSAPGAVVGSPKTIQDTNLELQGQLPSGKEFMIESIELLYLPGTSSVANTFTMALPSTWNAVSAVGLNNAMNDTFTFYHSGMVSLNILSKAYLTEMTQAFPPKASFEVCGAIASNSATTAEIASLYGKQQGRAYYLSPEISLQPAVNFSLTVNYPAAIAPPSGFIGRVIAIMDGYFLRASQ